MVGIAAQPAWGNPDHQKMLAKLKITSLTMWEERRKELFEIFDREFYGRQRSGEVWNDLLFRRKKPFALIDVNARRFGRAKLNRIWMDLEREVALCSMPLDRRV